MSSHYENSWPFDRRLDACTLAQALLGTQLLVRGVGGIVIETEAYTADDPASHSYRGPNPRNLAMFGPAGTAYVYLSYGLHHCLNIVGRAGEAVLIRALRPSVGIEEMRQRRPKGALCAGPGQLGQSLGVNLADNGKAFDGGELSLTLAERVDKVLIGPRIGISRAADLPRRFGIAGEQGLSRKFPG